MNILRQSRTGAVEIAATLMIFGFATAALVLFADFATRGVIA